VLPMERPEPLRLRCSAHAARALADKLRL
jgi:hypothetical protein